MRRVLFSASQLEFEAIRAEWLRSVDRAARRGVFVGGPEVMEFESRFAHYCETAFAAGTGNGTAALHMALKAIGVGPGDEVITAANTFVATVEAIYHAGAVPVLVDCEPETCLIDLDLARKAITPRTRAIVPVHLYGQMVDMRKVAVWFADKGIAVIEDAAQAAGARFDGKSAGSFGTAGCFSFYPDKNLGAFGDGGCIVTSDADIAVAVRKLRNHGGESRYVHDIPGWNSRLDTLQAIALSLKLEMLDEWNLRRRATARLYGDYVSEIGGIKLPLYRDDGSHIFHQYVIRVEADKRDAARKHLQEKGILTDVQYPAPVHLTPAFARLGYRRGDFPVSEIYSEQMISLPMHIGMTEEDVAAVAAALKELMDGRSG